MAKQLDRGGAQPLPKDIATIVQSLMLTQRQANAAKTAKTSSAIFTVRANKASRHLK